MRTRGSAVLGWLFVMVGCRMILPVGSEGQTAVASASSETELVLPCWENCFDDDNRLEHNVPCLSTQGMYGWDGSCHGITSGLCEPYHWYVYCHEQTRRAIEKLNEWKEARKVQVTTLREFVREFGPRVRVNVAGSSIEVVNCAHEVERTMLIRKEQMQRLVESE